MKIRVLQFCLVAILLSACGVSSSEQVPTTQLPNPAIYALTASELPEVGASWQQSYNQTTQEQGYKWAYQAYQAYQPGTMGGELANAFAVNNDIILYDGDMSHENLPDPPQTLGNIANITWKPGTPLHNVGNKSAVWKTTLGDLLTPVWWLEFYQGHAYVRISLFGFPDQIAPPILYGLADIVAARLPHTVEELRADSATQIATQPAATVTIIPQASATPTSMPISPTLSTPAMMESIPVLSYAAPP